MKKLIISIFALCFFIGATAQEPDQNGQNRQQREALKYEQVQSAKIAFFTSSLELTPQEAEAFWPVYNQFWKERESAHRRIQGSLRAIDRLLSGEKAATDYELKKMLDVYMNNLSSDAVIQKKYYEEFLKVLSIKQVAKLYRAEEDFRIKMIHQLRGGGNK